MGDEMKYNKLVRDKIPEIIKKNGDRAVWHVADDTEYWQKLKEKLREEVEEFIESESVEEIADIYEVIDAICEHKKFDHEKIEVLKKQKAAKRGGFSKRIILDK